MLRKLVSIFAVMALFIIGFPVSATQAYADEYYDGPSDTIDYEDENLCLVEPEYTYFIEHEGYHQEERRWKKLVPEVAEESHVENRFYRDIPGKDKVEKTLHTFYRDIPGSDETFDSWYRWKKVEPTEVTEYRYKKVVPATEGVEECKYKKKIPGTKEVKEYRWEAVFKKGKELKGIEVTSNRVCSKGDPGTWYLMPENVQPERFDGIAPTGNVNLSVYCNSYKDGLKGSNSVAYRYGETYTVYYPGPTASSWTENGSTPAAPSGSSWGARKERVKTEATPDTWEYKWSVGKPDGDGWIKVEDSCRWKVEPQPEVVEWFPGEDGWTQETKDSPWALDDTRTIPGPDNVTWFPSEDGWTQEVKAEPWIEDAKESRGNNDAVEGYREFKTADGTTLVEEEASEFEESEFPGWEPLNVRTEVVSEAVDGWREYRAADGTASKDILDAGRFKEGSFDGWTLLDSETIITQEFVEAYWVYYLSGGEPTFTLGEENWTVDEPSVSEWTFIDMRNHWIEEPWTEEVVVPALWEPCDLETPDKPEPKKIEKLPHTGPNDMSGILIGVSALLVLSGSGLLWLRSRKNS